MGADLIQVLVTPGSIVEALDVIEDFRLGLSSGAVDLFLDFFALEIAEERFSYRVVPAIPTATHAWTQPVVLAPTSELVTAELAALI